MIGLRTRLNRDIQFIAEEGLHPMSKVSQLQQFDAAYENFVTLVRSLTPAQFLNPIGGWSPRDIVAHLVGWNRNIRAGCQQILQGSAPSYHFDGPNDYRTLNAQFIA